MKDEPFDLKNEYLSYPESQTRRTKNYPIETQNNETYEVMDKTQQTTQEAFTPVKEENKPFAHRLKKIGHLFNLAFERNRRIKSEEIGLIAQTLVRDKQKDLNSFGAKVERLLYITIQMAQDEIGPMADRILIMAGHIGTMADRIGEMANRIVHTEHLIVNSAVLLVDLGLLLEAAIRNFIESFLYALSIVFNRNFQPAFTSTKHLDIISENIRQILAQQHEFSLKMLESQVGLRENTLKTYDKVYSKVM